jgi:DNA-binding protein H-NS
MATEYKSVFNCETQTEELVQLTKAEITQKQKDAEIAIARIAEYEAKLTAKAQLLDRLGITAEEAALLLA